MDMIYLDHNATTSAAPEVLAVMHEVLDEQWANPSSIHRMGQTARRRLEQAREQLTRTPRPLPGMVINPGVRSIDDFTSEDFELRDYDPHPHIAAPVAV